jgi:hypothetical protein
MNKNTEDMEYGQIAYDAYCEAVGWKSAVTGQKLPLFKDTLNIIQSAWIDAALAVIEAYKEYE